MNKKDDLLEWYQGIDQGRPEGDWSGEEKPEEKPEEKQTPDEIGKEVNKYAESYKSLAMARLLENKLMLLSDVFQRYSDDEKTKIKTFVKEIMKKLAESVNKL